MKNIFKKALNKLGLYTKDDLDNEVALKISLVKKMVQERLEPVNQFDNKFVGFLNQNKVVAFVKTKRGEYLVKIIDDAPRFIKRACLKEASADTPHKALANLNDVTDDDYVNEMSREFLMSADFLPQDVKEEALKYL